MLLTIEEIRLATEERTARLTILVDPRKKTVFEQLCAEEDATPSQVLRRLIRSYIEERTGRPWSPSPPAVDPVQLPLGVLPPNARKS
ncbi:MAG TPA: hypothetical protein VHW71_07745 [Steroidobacteraceae bacterium]|jgi:hypothetical protein|nr:hypothetical protein [Steroidobacteraceae bacterium]